MRIFTLTIAAARDFDLLSRHSYTHFGGEQTDRYFDQLEITLKSLAQFPAMGRRLERKPVFIHPTQGVLVVYRENIGGIEVVRVLRGQTAIAARYLNKL